VRGGEKGPQKSATRCKKQSELEERMLNRKKKKAATRKDSAMEDQKKEETPKRKKKTAPRKSVDKGQSRVRPTATGDELHLEGGGARAAGPWSRPQTNQARQGRNYTEICSTGR